MKQNFSIKPTKYLVGIDLGTTYSCVGVWRNNKVEIVPNEIGGYTTPSVVSFVENYRLIGVQAKKQITKNFKNTIYDAKRLIGRNYNDPIVQKDMKLWPFKVVKDENNKPMICVEYKNKEEKYHPEQISAMVLERLKQDTEKYLNTKIKDVVITVPAYFNNAQRQATIDAGKIAGLNVMKTINEPTAAAIAYGLNDHFEGKRNICVFDLGGGTFDVTILEINNKKFTVKATGGDTHLGGEDFDNLLMKYCIEQFKNETDIDISDDQKALRRLKIACETAKIELSSVNESLLVLDNLSNGQDFEYSLARSDLEESCKDLFTKCIEILEKTIIDSGIPKDEIDEIVLVGGSSRIPKVQELIKNFFDNKKELSKKINPDEAVAHGAAIQAALCNKEIKNLEDIEDLENLEEEGGGELESVHSDEENSQNIEGLDDLIIIDVVPLSLGINVIGGLMDVIIKRNTPIPYEKGKFLSESKNYITCDDYQSCFHVDVYEGEREFLKDNLLLKSYKLDNITPRKRGQTSMKVTFTISNQYNILNVNVVEVGKESNFFNKDIERVNRNEKEIENMIETALKMKEDDLEKRKCVEEKNHVEDAIYKMRDNDNDKYLRNKNAIDLKMEEVKKWLKQNPKESYEVYHKKIEEINNFYNALI